MQDIVAILARYEAIKLWHYLSLSGIAAVSPERDVLDSQFETISEVEVAEELEQAADVSEASSAEDEGG